MEICGGEIAAGKIMFMKHTAKWGKRAAFLDQMQN